MDEKGNIRVVDNEGKDVFGIKIGLAYVTDDLGNDVYTPEANAEMSTVMVKTLRHNYPKPRPQSSYCGGGGKKKMYP